MNLLEHAKAYVEAQDYIFDENREIAGKAFMAGYEAALETAALIVLNQSGVDHWTDDDTAALIRDQKN